jgi:hypothetical protein
MLYRGEAVFSSLNASIVKKVNERRQGIEPSGMSYSGVDLERDEASPGFFVS